MSKEVISLAEAALNLGVSAPLLRACVDEGVLDGSHQAVSSESVLLLQAELDRTLGTRTENIIEMLSETSA